MVKKITHIPPVGSGDESGREIITDNTDDYQTGQNDTTETEATGYTDLSDSEIEQAEQTMVTNTRNLPQSTPSTSGIQKNFQTLDLRRSSSTNTIKSNEEPQHRRKPRHVKSSSTCKATRKSSIQSSYSSDSSSEEDCHEPVDSDCSVSTDKITQSKQKSSSHNVKLPSFTGQEKWEVWFNRFEAVAKLKSWNEEDRLQELLPRLQGDAGDFTFDQLPKKTIRNYKKLVQELKNRFGVIETTRTYRLQFSRRKQLNGETPEKFAAELKRLYDKAYKNRYASTRQEDLLQRFLLGLIDYKARIHIELNKDPETIEEAVQEVITYVETMKNPNQGEENNKKAVRQVKGGQKNENITRKDNDKKSDNYQGGEKTSVESQIEDKNKSLTIKEGDLQSLFNKMFEDKKQELQHKTYGRPGTSQTPFQSNDGQHKGPRQNGLCYYCGQPGHFARNCFANPDRVADRFPSKNNNFKPQWGQNNVRINEEVEHLPLIRGDSPPLSHKSEQEVEHSPLIRGDSPPLSHKSEQEVEYSPLHRGDSPAGTCTAEVSMKSSEGLDDVQRFPPVETHIIGRQVLRCEGVYIQGSIEGIDVTFTADTGATRTVISTKTFRKILSSKRPKLQKSSSLASADGQPLKELGKAVFNLTLGELALEKELIVAEIEDEALLGLDILMKGDQGPADIKLTKGVILLNSTTIPCIQVGQTEPIRKVRSADHYVIQPRSEILIDVFVDRFDKDLHNCPQDYLIEPCPQFEDTYPLVMAACLVEIGEEVTNKVRLMNPFDQEVKLNQDAVIGIAEKLDTDPITLFSQEDSEESQNFNSVRRIKLTANNRPEDEQEAIVSLLQKYSAAFSVNDTDLGLTHLVEHTIDTGEAKPVKQPPRRVPLAFANDERKAITQMLDQGIIQKSNSPWGSPLQLVVKKNGKIRPCCDYRFLNALTRLDSFPIPRIQDCLDAVGGATLMSTFDLTSGYHQIPMKKDDISKTAFVTKYGLYEFKTMPFGVCNGPATCQRLMELVLHGLQWQICLIYLDDIIVFSNGFEEHMSRLDTVLNRILESGLKLKPEKCELLKSEVTFLGHVVSDEGIRPNPDNTAKILSWPVPKTVTEVRQLLGMGSYYRRFIKDLSAMVKPLTDLTKKSKSFEWTKECQIAFEKLKQAFTSTDIMAFPRDEGEYYLDTDACDTAIGAVLSQIQDGTLKVIAYGSRTLNKAERNYCITDKELLAVRYFIEYYRQYLLGRKFCVRTDHQALIWLFSMKEPKGRIARWLEILSNFDFSIEYRPGSKHGNADALSRCYNPKDCECADVDNLEYLKCGPCKKCRNRAIEMQSTRLLSPEIHEENNEDPTKNKDGGGPIQICAEDDSDIGPLLQWKEGDTRPNSKELEKYSAATRHYWHLWESVVKKYGLLFKQYSRRDGSGDYRQFLVPDKMKKEVLNNMHNSILSGHLGKNKTKEKLAQRYYWYEMKEDIQIWISQCDICGANKPPKKLLRAPLGKMPVGGPLDRLATDLLGPLPLTPRNNRYILTVTDYFTKWVEVFPVPDQTATTCANIILNDVICRFGWLYILIKVGITKATFSKNCVVY
ncbi:uncharacterized protein [Mytilus edulis]|uniref:uncharacterized protein n=1 Tax=Mytilus edulis TaxID=6550 RepID=UPI0039F08CB8